MIHSEVFKNPLYEAVQLCRGVTYLPGNERGRDIRQKWHQDLAMQERRGAEDYYLTGLCPRALRGSPYRPMSQQCQMLMSG